MKDLAHNLKATAGYAGATISTDTDTDSAIIIDTQGHDAIMFAAYSGALTDGTYKLKIMESPNSDFSGTPTEVPAYHVQDSFVATDDNAVKKVGASLTQRYCKLRITSTGTSSGGVFKGAIAILGHTLSRPVA